LDEFEEFEEELEDG